MPIIKRHLHLLVIICIFLLLAGLWLVIDHYWSTLMQLSTSLQRNLNQLLSELLQQTRKEPVNAGLTLVAVSFIYGVLHAIGPGHGKMIISTYIATHPLRLKKSLLLTVCASLFQGVVAIVLVTTVLGVLHLSTKHLQQTNLWVEKYSYVFVVILGIVLFIRAMKRLFNVKKRKQKPLSVKAITPLSFQHKSFQRQSLQYNALQRNPLQCNPTIKPITNSNIHDHSHCGCGHKHTLSDQELQGNLRSILLVIIAMGIRPCSGAILVLLFASLLDVYFWGIIATFAMALGTSLTISLIALLVHCVRQRAIKLADSYHLGRYALPVLTLLGSVLLILMGVFLYLGAQSSTQQFFLFR